MKYKYLSKSGVIEEMINGVNFSKNYDVIIIGGGTSGSIAALKLADYGYSVLVVEKQNFLGGIFSSTMFSYYKGSRGGYYEIIDDIVKNKTDALQITKTFGSNPLVRKTVYTELLTKNNVEILYNSKLIGSYVKDSKVIGIKILSDNNTVNVSSKFLIDSSSEASLCKITGIPVTKGREFDQLSQPFSNVRIFYNLKTDTLEFNNIDAGSIKQEDPIDYSKAVIKSLNNSVYSNKQENEFTVSMSPLIGVREGHVLNGVKQLTFKEIFDGYSTDEPLFYASANIDNHTKEMAFESSELCDWVVALNMWSTLVSIPVTKEMMISNEIDNVIVCGRLLSTDHDVASHLRMMRDTQKSGEAAAIILDSALKNGTSLYNVTYDNIVDELKKDGCLNEENNYGLLDNPPIGSHTLMKLPTTDLEFIEELSSNRPGFAMLEAYRKKRTDILLKGIKSENNNFKFNSAIVLALLDNSSGVNILEQAAISRDTTISQTSKSYNSLRGISAVYCLGRLHSFESYPLLLNMLENNNEFRKDNVIYDKFIGSIDDYHFQYCAHISRALISIANHNEIHREEILMKLNRTINNTNFITSTSLKSNPHDLHDMTNTLKDFIEWKTKKGEKSI